MVEFQYGQLANYVSKTKRRYKIVENHHPNFTAPYPSNLLGWLHKSTSDGPGGGEAAEIKFNVAHNWGSQLILRW